MDINFLKIDFNSLKESISNSSDELNEYYINNQGLFYSDEQRSFKYIVLTSEDYKDKVSVPEGFVDNAYAEYLLKANERSQTRISHIMVNKSNHDSSEDAYKAIEDIKSSIDSGGNFSELASSFSDDIVSKDTGGDLEYFSPDIFPVEFGEAIKGLEIGAVSSIVEIDDSFHVIKVTEINEVEVLSLSNLEKKIVADLVTSESLALLNDDFIELDNMIASNSSIESIGEVLSQDILSSNSYSVNNFKFDIDDRRIADYIFSPESEAGVTYAIEFEDSFIVLSINDIKESSLMSFEDVSPEVSDYLSSMKAVEKKALIVSEIDLAKTDGTLETVIAGYQFIVKDSFVGVKRNSSLLPFEILSEVFKHSSGEQVSVDSNNGDLYMVDVLKLNLPSDEYISEVIEQYQSLAQERASQNMSIIMNEDLFDNARVNLNNLVF